MHARRLAAPAAENGFRRPVQVGDTAARVQDDDAVANRFDARVAERGGGLEELVAKHRQCSDECRAREEERRRVEEVFGRVQDEDGVADPGHDGADHQDGRTPAVQIRRVQRMAEQQDEAGAEYDVCVGDVDPEAGASPVQHDERADVLDDHLSPEELVPGVGPDNCP